MIYPNLTKMILCFIESYVELVLRIYWLLSKFVCILLKSGKISLYSSIFSIFSRCYKFYFVCNNLYSKVVLL
jgi:hypothetical protein